MGVRLQRWFQKCIICYVFTFSLSHASTPHIIFILADDLGWNDVSFHGSDQIPTPNIDSLGYNGVILNRHYAQPVCTPSRATLMTGKYPIHTGMHEPLYPSEKKGLPLHEKILPQYLKELGYATHIVGKWHLGFYKRELTPLERGFDSHFGYMTGAVSYYDHIGGDILPTGPGMPIFYGHDMKRNYSEAWDIQGQYATDLFTNQAISLIERHDRDTPLFLYLSHLAVHAGNPGKLLEAPQEEINKFTHITNPNRRTYAAMVSKLDQSVGSILKALELKDMLMNSIVVFSSDNGAPCKGIFNNWGSNYPFRGHKSTLWEGGVRVPAVVWSPLITQPSRVSNHMMHISDWLPTLLAVAVSEDGPTVSETAITQKKRITDGKGYDTHKLNVDGVNQWPAISNGHISPRESLVIDIHPKSHKSAIIIGSFKYIKGATNHPHDATDVNGYMNLDSIISKNTPYKFENVLTSETWNAVYKYNNKKPSLVQVKMMRDQGIITCGGNFHHNKSLTIDCDRKPCLFEILNDPCEQENLVGRFPLLVKYSEYILDSYKSELCPESYFFLDPKSDPNLFNGTWNIWDL